MGYSVKYCHAMRYVTTSYVSSCDSPTMLLRFHSPLPALLTWGEQKHLLGGVNSSHVLNAGSILDLQSPQKRFTTYNIHCKANTLDNGALRSRVLAGANTDAKSVHSSCSLCYTVSQCGAGQTNNLGWDIACSKSINTGRQTHQHSMCTQTHQHFLNNSS